MENTTTQLAFDEMHAMGERVRELYSACADWFSGMSHERPEQRRSEAGLLFRRIGITFNVYDEEAGAERLIPFGIIP